MRWLGLSAGAAGLAASGLFGGLEPVKEPPVPPAVVGQLDRGEPWNVTVTRARLVGELPTLNLENDNNRWLAVVADVEVTAPESRNDLRDVLEISGVEGLLDKKNEPAHILVLRDDTQAGYLHPNMPERLAYLWEQSGTAPVPTEVRVTINKKTLRVDSLADRYEWLDLGPRAQLQVPVEDRRGK